MEIIALIVLFVLVGFLIWNSYIHGNISIISADVSAALEKRINGLEKEIRSLREEQKREVTEDDEDDIHYDA